MTRGAVGRKARAASGHLTDLEGATLGFIVRAGTCTAYAVRDGFRTSPSEFWSGSAGAVYPLIARLEKRGFLAAKADRKDGRMRRYLSATPAGEAALAAWLVDAERAAGLGFDPLRIRLFFADLIPPQKMQPFLADVETHLRATTPPPAPGLPHIVALHAAWSGMRRSVLSAFLRRFRRGVTRS
jgi:DNA-binding PadR family transcriptional regulator